MANKDTRSDLSAAEVEFAAQLVRHREASNLSQRELAVRIAFAREYVSRAEKPGGLISANAVGAIDAALNADGRLVELHERATKARKARRRTVRRVVSPRADTAAGVSASLLMHVDAGIDPLTIDDIEERADALAHRYYDIGPADLQHTVHTLRRRASDLLATGRPSAQRKRVLAVLAALTGILAESLFAVGERTDLHCSTAIALATEVGDETLIGWVRGTQAQIALHTGNPVGAMRYAQGGCRAPRGSVGAVRSATYLARASARVGDHAAARRAWRSAEHAWSRLDDELTTSVFSLSADYLACCELTVLAWLGESAPARHLVDATRRSGTPTVGRAIREIDSGLVSLLDGEIDEAVHAARNAFAIGASRWTTPLRDRFGGLLGALSAHGNPAVQELRRSCSWTSV